MRILYLYLSLVKFKELVDFVDPTWRIFPQICENAAE
jgi:hypothetical protein